MAGKSKKAIDRSVRDHSQEVRLNGDVIEVTPKLGSHRLTLRSFVIPLSEWDEALKSFNPNYELHHLVQSKQQAMYKTWVKDGGENPDRIVDSQVRAIKKLLRQVGTCHACVRLFNTPFDVEVRNRI